MSGILLEKSKHVSSVDSEKQDLPALKSLCHTKIRISQFENQHLIND